VLPASRAGHDFPRKEDAMNDEDIKPLALSEDMHIELKFLCLTLDEHFESSVEEPANQVRFHLVRLVGLLTKLEELERDHDTSEDLLALLTPAEREELWKRKHARAANPTVTQ
jgi:hypothetical protein